MYFDIEQENKNAERLAERAHELIFSLHETLLEKIDVDFPVRNVEHLQGALGKLEQLTSQLESLKKQLAYMHKCELEFVQEQNAKPSGMEIHKQRIGV